MMGKVSRRMDVAADPDAPEFRPPRAMSKRKDTKRWCRGKEGVEHRVTRAKADRLASLRCADGFLGMPPRCWHEKVCAECGRHLGFVDLADCPDQKPPR